MSQTKKALALFAVYCFLSAVGFALKAPAHIQNYMQVPQHERTN